MGWETDLRLRHMPDWLPDNLAALVVFKPIRIVLLIIAAFVLRRVLHRMINRSVRRAVDRPLTSRNQMAQKLIDATTVSAERRKQRIESLGSLASSTVSFVIFLVAILMILAEMGFNITTLVAGTSVVAVTLAFGMQSIVKDLVSGVFMLVEDQLGVGDYVDMEKASGVVEAIGLRVTELRDKDGTVWYVRNGEIVRVGNYSQGGPGEPPAEVEPEPA
jgi:small-conductance mechanosensitive channel